MRRNSRMCQWYINEIEYLIFLIKNNKPFRNYFEQSLYEALEEYYFLRDEKNRLSKLNEGRDV